MQDEFEVTDENGGKVEVRAGPPRLGEEARSGRVRPRSRVYRADDGEAEPDYASWIEELCSTYPQTACVLDLGYGCGVPVGRLLASRVRVTGVDFSRVQVERAHVLVPSAQPRESSSCRWLTTTPRFCDCDRTAPGKGR